MTVPTRTAAYLRASTLLILCVCTLCLGGAAGWYLWRALHTVEPPAVPGLEGDSGLAKVVDAARTAIKDSPTSAAAWGHMGMVLLAHRLYPQAEACFQEAIKLDPKDERWAYFQGLILLRTDPAAGIQQLERAVQLAGDAAAPRLKLAEVLLGEGHLDEAERNFQAVLANEPSNPRAEHGLGQLAGARGKWEESLRHLQRSAEYAPGIRSTHTLLAELHQRLGDGAAAKTELELSGKISQEGDWPDRYLDALSRLKTDVQSRTDRANALFKSGRSNEALKLAHETVQMFPESDAARSDYGVLLLNANSLTAAEHELREAVRIRPDSVAAQSALGLALLRQGRYLEAIQSLQVAVRLNPQYAIAYYNLGVSFRRLGDTAQGIQAFRKAVNCKPDFSIAHRELANALADQGELSEAVAHLQDAVRLAPGDELAKERLASLQQQVNRNAKK